MGFDWGIFGGSGFKPEPTFGDSKTAKLPDGDYYFDVTGVEQKPVQAGGVTVILKLRVLTPGPNEGAEAEKVSKIDTQEKANRFGYELKQLGFDVDNWSSGGRNFSDEMNKALAALPGFRFHGRKKLLPAQPGKEPMAVINILKRGEDDGKPAQIDATKLEELAGELSF